MYYTGVSAGVAKSPIFTFRLPAADLESVRELAKVYGAASTGAFIAELVGVVCSGDSARLTAFHTRLIQRVGEQLTLDLSAAMEAARTARKPAKQARKSAGRGKPALKRRKA